MTRFWHTWSCKSVNNTCFIIYALHKVIIIPEPNRLNNKGILDLYTLQNLLENK